MLRSIKILFVLLALGLISAFLFLPGFILNKITDYDPYTFEYVLGNPVLISEYGINGKRTPEDYYFVSEEVTFPSLDSIKLEGWYIKAKKPSSRSIIFVHGRTSNRLKTMKYLALVDSLDLDTLYNVFIPDMRNSGKSEASSTYMGYKFGEDLAAAIRLLKDSYGQDSIVLYGFSMGAMAICNTLHRKELKGLYGEDVYIERIILDSPLANVKETIRMGMTAFPAYAYFYDRTYNLYSQAIEGFGESMKLSSLYDPSIPMLILQSRNDATTLLSILEDELKQLPLGGNVQVALFDGPGHVKLFQDERTRTTYINEVGRFLRQQ